MICPACDGDSAIQGHHFCMMCDATGVICDTCREPPDDCTCVDGEEGEIDLDDMMGIEEVDDGDSG